MEKRTAYEDCLWGIDAGMRLTINFDDMSIIRGDVITIGGGEDFAHLFSGIIDIKEEDVIPTLIKLYRNYRRSKPAGVRFENSKYFIADRFDDLSNEDLMFGEARLSARKKLEAFVMCAIVSKKLTWQWGDLWFKDFAYMGEPKLILKKIWFNNLK